MTSSPFGRILWKEARAQFSLWLALVIGAFVLQATLLITQGAHVQGLGFVVAAAFVLTACFAVASVALLFAGETEDGTRDWLQQLPIRPVVLVTSKLTFAVVASALLLAATMGTGMLAAALWAASGGDLFKADFSKVDYPLGSIVGLFAWSLFFSLRSWRVPVVLLWAVVAEIVTVTVIERIFYGLSQSGSYGSPQTFDTLRTIAYFAVVAVVLVVDLVLAWRWAASGAGATTTSALRMRLLSLPLGEWRARTWLRLVTWAAQRGSLTARENAVLVWREARGAVPFVVRWCCVGVLVTDILGQIGGDIWKARPFQMLFLLATPVLCGLMACLGDQRQQTYRFLAERGVSPSRIWVIKHCVWLPLAIVIVLLFLRWDPAIVEQLRSSGRSYNAPLVISSIGSIHVPTLTPLTSQYFYNRPEDVALQNQYLWATGLLLYAAAQCAGFWIRRSILAVAAVIVAAPLLVGWNTILVIEDVPLSLASLPLTIALMAATLISASAWLRGRDSWKLRFVRLAAIALPVCAVATVAAAHPAFSVPTPNFPEEVTRLIAAREAASITPDAAWSSRWNGVLSHFRPPLPNRAPPEFSAEQRTRIRDELISLSDGIDNRPGRLDALVLSPDLPLSMQQLGLFLASPPTSVTMDESGESSAIMAVQGALERTVPQPEPLPESIEEQWRAYAAGLKITRYLAQECVTSEQWIDCIRARTPLLKAVREWSQRPDQTPDLLQQASDYLTAELLSHVGTREMTVNRYVFFSQLLTHRGRKWDQLARDIEQSDGRVPPPPLTGAVLPWYERERTLRLLGQVTADIFSNRSSIVDALQLRGLQLERWAASTPGMPFNVQSELYWEAYTPGFLQPQTLGGTWESNRAQTAGTALVVALQRHRLIQGTFPESLIDVIPEQYGQQVFADPYTGSLFGYAPHGLPGDLYLAGGRVLRAGQPLLWSAGYGNRGISQTTRPYAIRPPDGPEVPRGAYFASGHNGALPPDVNFYFEDAQPDKMKLINAGANAGATPTW